MNTCPECGKEFLYVNQVHSHNGGAHVRTPPPLVEIVHGTAKGWRAHKRRGETPCQPCRRAWAKYLQEWRKGRKG